MLIIEILFDTTAFRREGVIVISNKEEPAGAFRPPLKWEPTNGHIGL
jgi:hypothetical protein